MMQPQTRSATADGRAEWLSPFTCFVVGTCFAVCDALTTWYGLRFTHLPESNPVLRWAFDQIGLTPALVLRVVVGSAALGMLAWGVRARLPRYGRLFNNGCRILLTVALVSWGAVSVSNFTQILYARSGWS
jgi:hypothetical protein